MSSWSKTYIAGPDIDVSDFEREELVRFIASRPEIYATIPIIREKVENRDRFIQESINQYKDLIKKIEDDPLMKGVTDDLRRINPETGRLKALTKAELVLIEPLAKYKNVANRELPGLLNKKLKIKEWMDTYRNK